MHRSRFSPLLRRRMMVFLHQRGQRIDGLGTKNIALKRMVAAELGIELLIRRDESDAQIFEALADVEMPKKAPRVRKTDEFFQSSAWLQLRYVVLKREGARCQCCGTGGQPENALQVDHIKPRSKFPSLALDPSNLQVLCRNCNMGKSAWDETDWRGNIVPFPVAQTK